MQFISLLVQSFFCAFLTKFHLHSNTESTKFALNCNYCLFRINFDIFLIITLIKIIDWKKCYFDYFSLLLRKASLITQWNAIVFIWMKNYILGTLWHLYHVPVKIRQG